MFRRLSRLAVLSLVLGGLAAAAFVSPVAASGTTRYVDDDGHAGGTKGCNGTKTAPKTIQKAVAASGAGDTIIVCAGNYSGPVAITKNGLKIKTDVSGFVYLRPAVGQASDVPLVLVKRASNVVFKGFYLVFDTDGSCSERYYGIKVHKGPYTQILNNSILVQGSDTLGPCRLDLAIKLESGSGHTTVSGNSITDYWYGGIDFSESPKSTIDDNDIAYLHADVTTPCSSDCPAAYGITIDYSSASSRVRNNSIHAQATNTIPLVLGIDVREANTTVAGNTISYAQTGIQSGPNGTSSAISLNSVDHATQAGIALWATSANTVVGNTATLGNLGFWATVGSSGNGLSSNTASGNATDCEDQSTGSGTAGTANTWVNNTGVTSIPFGICSST